MDWHAVAEGLFDRGHDIVATGNLLSGTGHCGDTVFAVVGSTNHAEIGVELTLAMAKRVVATVRDHPARPILFLVDTQGQRLRHRDELLGIHRYMAHLAQCVEVARARGHRVLALVYDQALSGGFLASGMMADLCAALPAAEIRVMNLPAMARVTRLPEERLRALAATSPVFAPGAENYVQMGAIDALWDGDLAAHLLAALRDAATIDTRRELGRARGGRKLAAMIAERAASE
ncbi:MAG TPA: biotin-independent malonate decarboxylase subunit gamma [Casimicrobiaceae bacterium]|nr:biotin-independent malonate decarboxylase subunit gamma [Casimicrobiaceae bacterium]